MVRNNGVVSQLLTDRLCVAYLYREGGRTLQRRAGIFGAFEGHVCLQSGKILTGSVPLLDAPFLQLQNWQLLCSMHLS